MNTPNPLIPQGSLHHRSHGASNVRIAVVTIVAIHVVFFGGLLLQGCNKDGRKTGTSSNPGASSGADTTTNTLTYGSLPDTNLFYTNASTLPPERTNVLGTSPATNTEPPPSSTTFSTPEPVITNRLAAPATAPSEMKEYTVAKNDSFFKIARANNTTVAALTKANPAVDPHRLKPGQKIKIPSAEPILPKTTNNEGAGSYTVKPGDNLTRIAKNHGISVSELRAANGLKMSGLKVGQKLKIPEKREKAAGMSTGAVSQPKQL